MEHLNISPEDLLFSINLDNYNNDTDFTLFNILRDYIDIEPYYIILKSCDNYKLKNIYEFIRMKLLKLNRIKQQNKSLPKITSMNPLEFDNILKKLIDNNYAWCFFVINSIQVYLKKV